MPVTQELRKAKKQEGEPPARNQVNPLWLAFGLNVVLGCFVFLPTVKANPRLAWSFLGAAAGLFIFLLLLRQKVVKAGRRLQYEFNAKPVHYVQFVMHSSIYVYWGWYWREVYHQVPLIIAQIVFVYVLDMLVCWSRRDKWILGFGPVPIVLSANLFLWFRPDWYFLQFLMLTAGVLCKELITWQKEGRRAHIFNPSAIALFLVSIGLIVTHGTRVTWGNEIAVSQQLPPYIYLEIFVLGLVVQALFSVTLVTLSAAATLYVMNLAYTQATGLYFFVDSGIPAAVFLGLHLLITDPATSPKKNFGKIVFGTLYGAAVFGLYWLLTLMGVPTFYDKLLCVPPLNLAVRALDRASVALAPRFPKLTWTPRQTNFAFMGMWICLFGVMTSTGFLGGRHPGENSEFWSNKCVAGSGTACQTWVRQMDVDCSQGAGQQCLALALAQNRGQILPRDANAAGKNFAHACELGLKPGCAGILGVAKENGGSAFQEACNHGDGESCFLLGSLYFAGSGVSRDPDRAFALLQRSCSLGWSRGCSGLAECYRAGAGTRVDPSRALEEFNKACRGGIAPSCFSASAMYRSLNDFDNAEKKLKQGCRIMQSFAESSAAYGSGFASEKLGVPAVCSSAGD
jgi:hypothetical protein